MRLGPEILPDKWDHISDEEKRASLAKRGMEVRMDDGRVWWLHMGSHNVTLGVPESEAVALWAAYDLVFDPPPSQEDRAEFEKLLREGVREKRKEQWTRQEQLMRKRL